MRILLDRAVEATRATLFDAAQAPREVRLSTDTRTIEPGDTFLALRGERFDGHDYAADAVRRGAAMVVIDRPEARVPGAAAMLVEETLAAYMALAGAARKLFRGYVIAVTGSSGKTTTKAFLEQLLGPAYDGRVLASPANENNEIGTSRLLLRAENAEHDVLIAELGARHAGDIERLVEIARPDVGILTNVGEAHLEIMGSRQAIEETKWALFSRGARPVLNAFDEVSQRRASALDVTPHWFAYGPQLPDLAGAQRLTALAGDRRFFDRDGPRVVEREVEVRVPGEHNRANLAAALAGALELGVALDPLLARIPGLALPQGRYDTVELPGGVRLIYDAYNANASATIASLDTFAHEAAARRIAVLASMAELGEESQALHERVGAHAAGRVDVLIVLGEYAGAFARGAREGGMVPERVVRLQSNAEAASWLREHARRDDAVLLKGSRKYRLEEIVLELLA
jgi:UDP-N-acetylmuramoyl-tripeptide--D-alanyl-D-alanine ligase